MFSKVLFGNFHWFWHLVYVENNFNESTLRSITRNCYLKAIIILWNYPFYVVQWQCSDIMFYYDIIWRDGSILAKHVMENEKLQIFTKELSNEGSAISL